MNFLIINKKKKISWPQFQNNNINMNKTKALFLNKEITMKFVPIKILIIVIFKQKIMTIKIYPIEYNNTKMNKTPK